jgi:hypothetical protein
MRGSMQVSGTYRLEKTRGAGGVDAGEPEATMHALADEILKYRRAVRLLAKAIGWADVARHSR